MPIQTSVGLAVPKRFGLSTRIEAAMHKALNEAMAGGETRPSELKKVLAGARKKARAAAGLPQD